MSRIAFTTVDHGSIAFGGSDLPTVLLIDSVFETISVKRVTENKNRVLRLWRRYKSLSELQSANPECAVYCCSLDKTTAYLCVSNLSITNSAKAENELENYISHSKHLRLVCSQLMSIGNGMSSQYRQVLMLINSPNGVRHVYFIDHKPVFTRLLPPNNNAADYVEPLQATQQHLINRCMLDGDAKILCSGISTTALLTIKTNWVANTVDTLDNDTSSISSLAVKFYTAKRLQRFLTAQLPTYWLGNLGRYRYRSLSILITLAACLLILAVAIGLFGFNMKDWSTLLRMRVSITSTAHNTKVLKAQAAELSSAPKATAERLQRLDLLRSLQPAGADVLLSTVSMAFEAHPRVSLNHISWFTVVADEGFQSQTRIVHRDHLSMDAVNSDYLSILITGEIKAQSLSEQQALFSEFKFTLMSLQGVDDLVEEQTPVSQWRMPNTSSVEQSELTVDSFTLRFSLSDVSS